jgi:hypothetical protein
MIAPGESGSSESFKPPSAAASRAEGRRSGAAGRPERRGPGDGERDCDAGRRAGRVSGALGAVPGGSEWRMRDFSGSRAGSYVDRTSGEYLLSGLANARRRAPSRGPSLPSECIAARVTGRPTRAGPVSSHTRPWARPWFEPPNRHEPSDRHERRARMRQKAPAGQEGLVTLAVLVYCAAWGSCAAAWQLPLLVQHSRGRGQAFFLRSRGGLGVDAQDGDRSLRKAKEERTQIAALQRLGGVKAGVRPSKENEDLIGKWVCTYVCVCVSVHITSPSATKFALVTSAVLAI